MMRNLEHLKRNLYAWYKEEDEPKTKKRIGYCIHLLENGLADVEDIITEAKNIGPCNPGLPGDWIGRPDDDF